MDEDIAMRNLQVTVALALLLGGWSLACSQTPPEAPQANANALALVDGKPISQDDLDIRGKLLQLEQQRYEVMREALDEAIALRLLETEAERQGVSLEALLEKEVHSKVSEPSALEIETFYEQQKQRIRQPLEDVRDRVAEALKAFQAAQLRDELVGTLREKSAIEVRLEPPRVPIDLTHAPLRGPADAPVTIVEFSDFQCPFCKRVQPVIQQLLARYPEQVNWRFKDLPLNSIHPSAQRAAEAARCAGEQGKFWEYRDSLFGADQITLDMHKGVAESLGLDSESFLRCLSSEKHREIVESDNEEAAALGITGTPTFVINGIVLAGAQPFEEFTRVIESELKRKGNSSLSSQ
jgi:protein-disulfide isomerase